MDINKDPSNSYFESTTYPYWMGKTQLLTRGELFIWYYNTIRYLASTVAGKQPMIINKDPPNLYFESYYPYWMGRTQFFTRGKLFISYYNSIGYLASTVARKQPMIINKDPFNLYFESYYPY